MSSSVSAAALNVGGRTLKHHNLLLVIKQTAFEEYSQVGIVYTQFALLSVMKWNGSGGWQGAAPCTHLNFELLRFFGWISFILVFSCYYIHDVAVSDLYSLMLALLHYIAQTAWSSSQGIALEAIGKAIQSSQAVCE